MKIHGLMKMTLLDFPGQVACTVFLGGCDMRCPFCHNAELLDPDAPADLDEEALYEFLGKRHGLLDGVVFTGGEPLLRKELPDVMKKIREMGFKIKLDTNGNHPDRLMEIVEAGLVDYVAMDIKNSPDRYAQTAGLETMDLGPVRESVAVLMDGKTDYEFRTTTVAELHDEDSFRGIGQWIRGARRYFLQKFTDRDTVPFGGFHAPADDRMRAYAEIVREYVPSVELRGIDD
jgi:pyruvate formate lyase activating enzyme